MYYERRGIYIYKEDDITKITIVRSLKKRFFLIFKICIAFLFLNNNSFAETIFLPKDSLKKEIRVSFGIGIAYYQKSGFSYSFDFLGQLSKKTYVGVSLDNYKVGKKGGSSPINLHTISINALHYGKIYKNKVDFFLGGGGLILFKPGGFGLSGYARIDYKFIPELSVGLIYKQPFFIGTDYSAPPLMLFELAFSLIL